MFALLPTKAITLKANIYFLTYIWNKKLQRFYFFWSLLSFLKNCFHQHLNLFVTDYWIHLSEWIVVADSTNHFFIVQQSMCSGSLQGGEDSLKKICWLNVVKFTMKITTCDSQVKHIMFKRRKASKLFVESFEYNNFLSKHQEFRSESTFLQHIFVFICANSLTSLYESNIEADICESDHHHYFSSSEKINLLFASKELRGSERELFPRR